MVVIVAFARPIAALVIADPETIDQATLYLQICGLFQIPQAGWVVTQGAFAGSGRTAWAGVVGLSAMGLRVPTIWVLLGPLSLGESSPSALDLARRRAGLTRTCSRSTFSEVSIAVAVPPCVW